MTVKNIIKFNNSPAKSKRKFLSDLQRPKERNVTSPGGHYWISSISAVSNGFKSNDTETITNKICELEEKHDETKFSKTKNMYRRNISILNQYIDFDFQEWMPAQRIAFLRKNKIDSGLNIKGIPIQVTPQHVFSFNRDGKAEIGAIWFNAQLNGYNTVDLAIFTDILHRYLKSGFAQDFIISKDFCIAVDLVNFSWLNYRSVQSNKIPLVLDATLDEMLELIS